MKNSSAMVAVAVVVLLGASVQASLITINDAYGANNASMLSSYSFAVTNVAASQVLAVSFGARKNSAPSTAQVEPLVSWVVGTATQSMTKALWVTAGVTSVGSYDVDSGIFYLTSPNTGTGTVYIDYASDRSSLGFGALLLSGVNTANPIGDTASSTSLVAVADNPMTLSLTPSATNSLLISSLTRGASTGLTACRDANGTQTILLNGDQGNRQTAIGYLNPSATTSSYAMEWDVTTSVPENRHAFTAVEFVAIPEPATLGALLIGVSGLLWLRRRVRKE